MLCLLTVQADTAFGYGYQCTVTESSLCASCGG